LWGPIPRRDRSPSWSTPRRSATRGRPIPVLSAWLLPMVAGKIGR
jgi:hypothetical protein